MKTVWVKVKIQDGCEDDDGAVGIWQIELNGDLEPGIAAGAALDVFHESVAIDCLDYYEIVALDPSTHVEIDEADDYKRGSCCGGNLVGKLEGQDVSPSP